MDSTREDFQKFWVTQNSVSFVGHFLRRKNTKSEIILILPLNWQNAAKLSLTCTWKLGFKIKILFFGVGFYSRGFPKVLSHSKFGLVRWSFFEKKKRKIWNYTHSTIELMKFAKILPDVYVKIKLQNQDCIFWSRILLERISKSFESLKIWFRSLVIFWEEKTQNLKLYPFYHWIDEIRQNSPRRVREN